MAINAWQVAIRKKESKALYEGNFSAPFIPVPNSVRYWAADPFLLEKDNKTYIFAEIYDRLIGRGTLGYCTLGENGKATKWKKCIQEKYHLSFPNFFYENGQLCIMPESFQAKELYCYRCTEFPMKWEKYRVLARKCSYVDSVWISEESREYCLTMNRESNCAELLHFHNGKTDKTVLSSNTHYSRNAGKIINSDTRQIRVYQDCYESYGKKIGFCELDFSDTEKFEKAFSEVSVENITVDGSKEYNGIHTYNSSEQYEVIDLRYYDKNLLSIIYAFIKSVYHAVLKK